MADKPNFVLVPDEPAEPPAPRPTAPGGPPMLQRLRTVAARAGALLAHRAPGAGTASVPTRPRLVFGFDATASREPAWAAARQVTDALVRALPGELDVALAVHGGGLLHTFTEFTANPGTLRDRAAAVRCLSGRTRMLPILARAIAAPGVREMGRRGIKLFVLHDVADWNARRDAELFLDLARRTGGCVLPFDAAAPDRLRELLAAIAVYAVGGTQLLEKQRQTLPAAALLLRHLDH
jgi:hypothetical protein